MKILWHSVHPRVHTGYGSQSALFLPRIRDLGHDVAISAYYGLQPGFGITQWEGMLVYPADHTNWNKMMLRQYAEDHAEGGDITDVQVIALTDVWPWIAHAQGGVAAFEGLRLAAWCPVDHMPVPPGVILALREFNVRPIAMSRFGEEQLRLEGFDPLYVPHGVDTEVYRPKPEAARELRRSVGIADDAFVVGMVANNQGDNPPRKAFPQVIQAFAALREKHADAILYLHCDVKGLWGGIDLAQIITLTGIPHESVVIVDQARYLSGAITPDKMATVYSMIDVLANPSYGEGFGIPIIEAQACGTPVVVTDWTAMPELCGAGWRVEGDPWYDHTHGSFYMYAPVGGIYSALDEAHDRRRDTTLHARAREFALDYDVDKVMADHWTPALDELGAPREVAPLAAVNGNRAQRRSRKKAAA